MTPLVLESLAADGAVLQRTPLVIGVTLVQAQPGVTYRVINDLGGRVTHAALIQRVGDDLRIDLPQERNLSLEGFFTRCVPADPCVLSLENIGGIAGETVTPTTPPVAPLADGGLLMYASGAPVAASLASESAFSFKPLIGVAGGVAILGAAGGGGGNSSGGSGDSTPPPAPELATGTATRLARPVFTGTAEAGAKVTLTLFDANRVTYETSVAGDGAWRIDTAVAVPLLGAPITLSEGVPVALAVIATDAAGNASPITAGSVTLDTIAPAAPIIASPLLTQDTTPVIRGTAEPGSQVTVGLDLDRNATTDAAWVVTTQPSGEWAVDLGTPAASGTLPGGQLANRSSAGVVVTAVDDAGNPSPSTTAVLAVNASLPAAPTIGTVAGDNAVNALEAGAGVTITGTVPETARSVTVSWGAASIAATLTDNDWKAVFGPTQLPADGSTPVVASYVSAFGATSAEAARAVLVDRLAPGAPTITQVPENAGGGINAGEAADGTTVRVGLGGTGALAGDRIVLQWGSATATHTLTGAEVGGNLATVNVPATTLGKQGDGTFGIVARLVDIAGNEGHAGNPYTVSVDTVAPVHALRRADVYDDVLPGRGTVPSGGLTNDTRPELRLKLDALLSSDESLRIHRATGSGSAVLVGTASLDRNDQDFPYSYTETTPLARGKTYTYTADVVDAAGNVAPLSLHYSIVVI
ncbi:MAG: hypothetical protein KJZ98_16405 [Burkholderiaceae bacterium]|nr:hypothetical protein [Burkholderiaceae bacterium]